MATAAATPLARRRAEGPAGDRGAASDRRAGCTIEAAAEVAPADESLGGEPLVVVTATVGEQRGWFAAQNRLAKLSIDSVHLTVPDATHESLLEDKRFARIASHAVTQVAQFLRSGQR